MKQRRKLVRCAPGWDCPQSDRCARNLVARGPAVNASIGITPRGCALFIDVRGVRLLEDRKP